MKRRYVVLVVLALVALSLLFLFYPEQKEEITIVSVNDLHGALMPEVRSWSNGEEVGGMAQIAGYIDKLREENPNILIIDVGDAFQGRPISNLFYGESVIDCYNAMGVDCLVIGNHEFDWGVDTLKARMEQADFPFLSANVLYEGREFFEPYIIKEIGGQTVQIIGLTTELTPEITERKKIEGFQFTDAGEAIKKYYNQSCDITVVAGHMGVEDENTEGFIAFSNADVPVDVFLGGHTHEKADWTYDNCTFVEAYSYGTAMDVVNIKPDGEINSEIIDATPEYEDKRVDGIITDYYNKVKNEMEKVIAFSASALQRNSNGESALGNWMCDVMREAFDADVALTNSGGIRDDLSQGNVTVSDMYDIMPFDNTVTLVELTGTQLKEALETGVSTGENGKLLHGIVQVSGLNFTYDPKAPNGQKVRSVYVGGKPLKSNEKYLVATNSFMAGGGDGYYVFGKGSNIAETGVLIRDLLLQSAESSKRIDAGIEGRIRAV
jgi:2',3'-cyclic-nucleotide 2'-phosphodiesterase (5'-nucleotidase family)